MSLQKKQQSILNKLKSTHAIRKENLCLCEGLRVVRELYNRAPELVKFTLLREDMIDKIEPQGEVIVMDEKEFSSISTTVNSQGVLAVAQIPVELEATENCNDPFILALDKLNDPGNFGTICRTIQAVGLSEIWYTKGTVNPFGSKALRSSMGASFSVKFRGFEDLLELKSTAEKLGYNKIYLTKVDGDNNCFETSELFDKSVIVIGGEANGVSELTDSIGVTIPMPGKFESLNAAQAATIFLFEYVRRTFIK